VAATAPPLAPGWTKLPPQWAAPWRSATLRGARAAFGQLIAGQRLLIAVLGVGSVLRAALVPLTHGADFHVWDLASRATMAGVNVYAHHPAYTGGPYAYLPLFLYIEVPMQWLSMRTGVSFTILGKLPIVAADLLATLLLARIVRACGGSERRQALAAGLFFLNPLVLYDGAFYGRFDSVCIALLLLAVAAWRPGSPASRRFGAAYALAIAAKTFPIVILPWLLRRGRRTVQRVAVSAALVLGSLCTPYLITAPLSFLRDQLYDYGKLSGALSWQVVLHTLLSGAAQLVLSQWLLLLFVLVTVALGVVLDDLVTMAAAATLLFIVLSKVVIEQYLTWPLAFLILLAVNRGSRPAACLLGLLTAVGMLVNPYIHPLGTEPGVLDILLALAIVAGVGLIALADRRSSGALAGHTQAVPPGGDGRMSPAARDMITGV
jgi:uncharacterized membrane protein